MKWSQEQDAFLAEHSGKGPDWCRREIFKKFGVLRSADTTERHGRRIGVVWVRFERCPHCGREVKKLNFITGLCRDCSAEENVVRAKELRKVIEEYSATDGNSPEAASLKKQYDRLRKWNNRHSLDM